MLVLTQIPEHRDAEVVIDLTEFGLDIITVEVVEIRKSGKDKPKVRVGYVADPRIRIYRRSVWERIERAKRQKPEEAA